MLVFILPLKRHSNFDLLDYKRTQDMLSKCRFCYHEGQPPQLAMISLGTTCYLALPNVQELTPGNCLIVPIQHVSSTLECDDDVWTEIRVSVIRTKIQKKMVS
jgi:diadenosine tetraphosphate (Ap4A) HIT family hydrolase